MAQIVSFHCVLKNNLGKIISETTNHDVVTEAGQDEQALLQGLASQMRDLKSGETRRISLSAPEAYGFYDPRKVILYPRRLLPRGLALVIDGPVIIVSKSGQRRSYRIVEIHKDMVLLDGNHPLAGQDLIFEIEIISVREASPSELLASSPAGLGYGVH